MKAGVNNMTSIGTIREFHTRNFKVIVDAIIEHDLDISWDDTDETRKGLENGSLTAFCARVRVIHKPTGSVLGSEFLGNCIYRDIADFQDHRECAKRTREYEAQSQKIVCGSYFSQMVSAAISEARRSLDSLCRTHRRKGAK